MAERCTICGQFRDECPSHSWIEMRILLGNERYDIPGKTGDQLYDTIVDIPADDR